MCGRYVLSDTIKVKQRHGLDVLASYNIAPSHEVLVLNPNPVLMKWSYSPKWKLDMNLINCRSETLIEKPSFRGALRCIFVANGWYEWERTNNQKIPYYHHCGDELIYFAGIWRKEKHKDQKRRVFSIITKSANKKINEIHHRMPVVLNANNAQDYLDTNESNLTFENFDDVDLNFNEVSKYVNNPKNNDENCITNIN